MNDCKGLPLRAAVSIRLLVFGYAALLGCLPVACSQAGQGGRRPDSDSSPSAKAQPSQDGGGKPTDEGEGVPGYLVDPGANITVSTTSSGGGLTAQITGKAGAVGAASGSPAGVVVMFWRIPSGTASPLTPVGNAIHASFVGSAKAQSDGSFSATMPLESADLLLITTVGDAAQGTVPLTSGPSGSPTAAFKDTAAPGTAVTSLAPTPAFLYAYGEQPSSSSFVCGYRMDPATGQLAAISPCAQGTSNQGGYNSAYGPGVADSTKHKLYIPDPAEGAIDVYAIDPATGQLTFRAPYDTQSAASPVYFVLMIAGSSGQSLYVVDGTNTLSAFAVQADGTLASLGTQATPSGPSFMVSDPQGKYLFVANSVANSVSAFSIQTDGAPSLVGSYPTDSHPHVMVMDPTGAYLYVHNDIGGTIGAFAVQPSGALTPSTSNCLSSGYPDATTTPSVLGMDGGGKILLVPDGRASILGCAIGAGGALTPTGSVNLNIETSTPTSIIMSPVHGFAYVSFYDVGSVFRVATIQYSDSSIALVGSPEAVPPPGTQNTGSSAGNEYAWGPNGSFLYGVAQNSEPIFILQPQADGTLKPSSLENQTVGEAGWFSIVQ